MDILGLLATATEEAEGIGISLNLDLLETNVINLAIVLGLLVYIGRNFFGKILAERKAGIEAELREVEERKQQAEAALAEQQEKLAQAKAEAQRILTTAQDSAKASSAAILAQAEADIRRMRTAAEQDLSAEEERVIAQLRQQVIDLALGRAEAEVPRRLDESKQRQLIDRSLSMLGGR